MELLVINHKSLYYSYVSFDIISVVQNIHDNDDNELENRSLIYQSFDQS